VDACPTQALKFLSESEAKEYMAKAEVMQPESKAQPRVYYLNIPKKFVAGTVYDPVIKEIIEGAECTLIDTANGKTYTAKTDGFGDFWFEGLPVSTFNLKIASNGKKKVIDVSSTEKDVNLGDIPLN
jgi:hypothetical protein